MDRFFSSICKILLKPIVDAFLVKEARGLENVPKENFILTANHQSHLDQIVTAYVCVPRGFKMIGQTDRYTGGIDRILREIAYFIGGVIPLNRKSEESRKRAIEKAIDYLKKGGILIIYPEGTRTRTGDIQKGKTGVAKIFLKTGKPILPVGIKGTFELLPPGKAFPAIKRIIEINVGQPLYFNEELEKAKNLDQQSEECKEIMKKIAEKVMEEISMLAK